MSSPLIPQPSSLTPRPSSLNPRPSSLNPRPSLLRRLAILGLAALQMASCTGDIFVEAEPQLVVEGWICNDEPPIVFVTSTLPLSLDKQPIDGIDDHVLRWAVVTVSDGEESVTLTGRANHRYPLPCYFTTGRMTGKLGHTYTLDVTYKDMHAHAVTTLHPLPARVEGFRVEKQAQNDSLYSIQAEVQPQVGGSGYYKFLVGVEQQDSDYYSSYMGTFTDQNIGQGALLPVHRSHHIKRNNFVANFRSGETVHIRFAAIDSLAYTFWTDYERYLSTGNNVLFPTSQSLRSNIEGGYGYWHGYASTTYTVRVDSFINKVGK